MRWVSRAPALLAAALASLLAPGPVSANRVSAPPQRAFVIDVIRGTVGGLKVDEPASSYVRRLGIPDYVGSLESKTIVEMLWSRRIDPRTGWATATLHGRSSTTVTELRFEGLFRTLRGDRRGTSLSTFLRHWRLHDPVVTRVARAGVLVEYNVVVGAVVFAFDSTRTLQAVGLAPSASARQLCVILSDCIVTRIP